ncbi:MAG: FAD-dependent oxidoreductase [Spirochaetes bacterium]|nr:FAD-dependent oxidoreductase [Spirochaetota bacterium]
MKTFVIVGGVAGGATAAARLRRLDETINIIIIERENYISYANCGLPYYIGETIKEWDNLFVQNKESFGKRFNIDVKINHEAMFIDRENKIIKVKDLKNNKIFDLRYDKLLLSPGAEPLKPNIPGIENKNIFTLRNPLDTLSIKNFIKSKNVKKALIVGAGFIGLEVAENLYNLGIKVSIVELSPQVMPAIDFDVAIELHQHLKSKGVEFYLNDQVIGFESKESIIGAKLLSGRKIYSDMVVLSIGVKPENKLAKDASLALGKKGGILVNEFLQTSDPDIYAVGDVIEGYNYLLEKNTVIPLAGPANKQARIAAENMLYGNNRKYKGSIGVSIAKVFDLTVATAGLTEKICKTENISYEKVLIHSSSHAGYYPGALPLTLKLIFKKENGKILGAQLVGYDGVDKRIDVISAMIQKEGTIFDLVEFEHAYAPPYSSAKDPINIAGYIAENIFNNNLKMIYIEDFIKLDRKEIFLIDVRTKEEFDIGTIEGAINIPVDDLRNCLNQVPKDKKIILFCGVGLRGYIAYRILIKHGYSEVFNLMGGYKTYQYFIQKQSNEDIFENDFIGIDDNIYQLDKSKFLKDLKNYPIYDEKNESFNINKDEFNVIAEIDACGLNCPGPILKLKKEFSKIENNGVVLIKATDPGFKKDIFAWAKLSGNTILDIKENKGVIYAKIMKGNYKSIKKDKESNIDYSNVDNSNDFKKIENKNKVIEENIVIKNDSATIIVFSNDMDKVLASFVLALGAISAGKKVTMFFTFWGLTVIRKKNKIKTKKDFMSKMFAKKLPSNLNKLKLSKMNLFGLGPLFMKIRMKQKNVDFIDNMMKEALENGVNIVACQMSMDVMGISKEELLDDVEIGGVATYMEKASESNINLFI